MNKNVILSKRIGMVVVFGKIKKIDNNEVTIENISGKAISS